MKLCNRVISGVGFPILRWHDSKHRATGDLLLHEKPQDPLHNQLDTKPPPIHTFGTFCLQGLGIPGLSKEAAEKESLKRALAESCSSTHHVFPGESPAFLKGGRGTHGSFGEGFGESDLRATEEELEQAVRVGSLGCCVFMSERFRSMGRTC